MLGIVDHGSRWLLALRRIHSKASIALLRPLLEAIEQTGRAPKYLRTTNAKKPERLRTDNERVFTSRLFRLGLWWLGIRHQRTDKGCPGQKRRNSF